MLPNFGTIKTFTDPFEAIKSILSSEHIDVLFIDIDMMDLPGSELSKLLRHKIDKIVITSLYQKHAFDAYEIEADAFLLKPYSISKFVQTMDKVFLRTIAANETIKKNEDFFFIKGKNEKFNLVKIKLDEIVAIESLQNYISIITVNRKVVAHLTLTKIKELLKDQNDIIQVHRSFLISKRYIEEIESNIIKMQGDLKITLGENYRNDLLNYIKEKTIKTGRMSNV
jgi:DNA-binding LytR/AlgR family response regulator